MSSHTYHDALPGYSDQQIWHDGCDECEHRSASRDHGIATLDRQRFAMAWRRAIAWNRGGLPDISISEVPLLSVLWSIYLRFESAAELVRQYDQQCGPKPADPWDPDVWAWSAARLLRTIGGGK